MLSTLQGTADAVRQYLWLFENTTRTGVQDFLILSGALQMKRALASACTLLGCSLHMRARNSVSCCDHADIFTHAAAGDHLYRMDYAPFVQKHRESGADITVAALPMDAERAEAFGVMKVRSPAF